MVPQDHMYRKFKQLWDFSFVKKELKFLETDNNYKGYGLFRLFSCLLLQFMEDLSDRELSEFMKGNNYAKWFAEFGIAEQTPHYTLFGKLRKKIGTNRLSKIFDNLRSQL